MTLPVAWLLVARSCYCRHSSSQDRGRDHVGDSWTYWNMSMSRKKRVSSQGEEIRSYLHTCHDFESGVSPGTCNARMCRAGEYKYFAVQPEQVVPLFRQK